MLVLPGGKDIYYLGAGHLALLPGNHSAAREVLQETGLAVDPNELPLVGTLHVIGDGDEKEVRIYRHDCTGNPKLTGCDELSNPAWYPTQRIPYGRMPRDYSLWLPQLLEGDSVTAFLEVDGDSTYGAVYHAKIDPPGRLQEISITPEP